MQQEEPGRIGSLERARGTRGGFSLIEVIVAIAVIVIAIVGAVAALSQSALVGESTPDWTRAQLGAQQMIERLRVVPLSELFRDYNATPDDDVDGPGTGPGSNFAVAGLAATPDDVDGFVGEILFPTPGALDELREDLADEGWGMPLDLDGDGEIGADPVTLTYVQLPIRVRVEWRGRDGEHVLEYETILSGW